MGEFEDVTMMGRTLWLRGSEHVISLALSCVAVASVFLLVTLIFIPFGQIVGRYLDTAANTAASSTCRPSLPFAKAPVSLSLGSPSFSAFPFARFKSGNKDAGPRPGPRACCS